MQPGSVEVLSAFMDGETVEPEALAAALATPGSHEALVDFARFRIEARSDESRPSPRFYAAMDGVRNRRPVQWPWQFVRAAAATIVLALSALGAMTLLTSREPGPPVATQVVRFTPGIDWHEGGVEVTR
jgi:hypothetical protein